jgi:hypothetical protein
MIKGLKIFVIAAAASAAPLTFDAGAGRVTMNDAACQSDIEGGTCCGGSGTCYPGTCSTASCATVNAYWKSDGPC